jgi:SAM-dependent methyltransferase
VTDRYVGRWVFPVDDSPEEQVGRRGGPRSHPFDLMASEIAGALELRATETLLDLGCGNALISVRLARRARRVIGADFSHALLRQGGDLARAEAVDNLLFLEADAADIGRVLRDGSVDAACCYGVLQYFDALRAARALEGLARVLRPGGRAMIGDVPDRLRRYRYYTGVRGRAAYWYRRALRRWRGQPGEDSLGWWWAPEGLVALAQAAGFEAVVRAQHPELPHAHYRFDLLLRTR